MKRGVNKCGRLGQDNMLRAMCTFHVCKKGRFGDTKILAWTARTVVAKVTRRLKVSNLLKKCDQNAGMRLN